MHYRLDLKCSKVHASPTILSSQILWLCFPPLFLFQSNSERISGITGQLQLKVLKLNRWENFRDDFLKESNKVQTLTGILYFFPLISLRRMTPIATRRCSGMLATNLSDLDSKLRLKCFPGQGKTTHFSFPPGWVS